VRQQFVTVPQEQSACDSRFIEYPHSAIDS
jgi:hypothetical protein